MKTTSFAPWRVLLLALVLPLGGLAQESDNSDNTSEDPYKRPFWSCSVPGGAYIVALNRITSVGIHDYLVDGGFLVTEVTIDTQGAVTARFYYGEPYNPESPSATGQVLLNRATDSVKQLRDRTGADQYAAMAIKNYPTTTHAKTIEFNIGNKQNLQALYQSVTKAWLNGKGARFTIK